MKTKLYSHSSKESNYFHGQKLGLSRKALSTFEYALYEVEFDVEVNENTGDIEILKVDGRNLEKKGV